LTWTVTSSASERDSKANATISISRINSDTVPPAPLPAAPPRLPVRLPMDAMISSVTLSPFLWVCISDSGAAWCRLKKTAGWLSSHSRNGTGDKGQRLIETHHARPLDLFLREEQ